MTEKKGGGGKPGEYRQAKIELSLFDLESDPGETTNLAADHPDVVERLTQLGAAARREIVDEAK